MNRFKKEKYVWQVKEDNGWRFIVKYKGITKSFSEGVFGSARRAYDQAVAFRDKALTSFIDVMCGVCTQKVCTVFNETFDILPVREETKRKHVIYFGKYADGDMLITDVTKATVIQSLNSMIRECSDDTIARMLSIWRRIFKTAIIKEYVRTDVTVGITPPKSQLIRRPHRKVLTDRATLDLVENGLESILSRNEALAVKNALEMMYYTGVRPCECFALNKEDIADGYVDINKELGTDLATQDETERKNVIRKCKTEASIRRIPMPEELKKKLENYKPRGRILFPTDNGTHFNVSALGQKLHRLGIPFNMYQLRHTLATDLVLNRKADERTIIEILGHTRLNMSVYYSRSNDSAKKEALEKR